MSNTPLAKLAFILICLTGLAAAQDLRPSCYVGLPGIITVRGGKVYTMTGSVTTLSQTDLTPATNATTYIYLDVAGTPAVKSNTTGFPSAAVFPMCTVVKDIIGTITSFTDNRPEFVLPRAGGVQGWNDVTAPAYGAVGDRLTNLRGSFTANNNHVTITSGSGRSVFASTDVGKAISVMTVELPLRPDLNGLVATQTCSGTGTLGNASFETEVRVSTLYYNSGTTRESQVSYEQFVKIPSGATNYCVKVTSPSAVPAGYIAGYSNYHVRMATQTLNTATTYFGKISGNQLLANTLQTCQTGGTTPSVGSTCEIDSLGTGASSAVNPGSTTFVGTITAFISSTDVTVSGNVATYAVTCPTGPCETVTWGTDNTAAIQAALDAVQTNSATRVSKAGTIFLPGPNPSAGTTGSYLITGSLTYPSAACLAGAGATQANCNSYLMIAGAGARGNTTLSFETGVSPVATSEIVTIGTGPIFAMGSTWNQPSGTGPGNNQVNAGPTIRDLGFKDGSNACQADGALKFLDVSRVHLENVSFGDFCKNGTDTLATGATVPKGYGARWDSGCAHTTANAGCDNTAGFNNFEEAIGVTSINVRFPLQFVNGKSSENRIERLEAVGTQLGGGSNIYVDPLWDTGINTSSGGQNYYVHNTGLAFPVCYYTKNDNASVFDGSRCESTSNSGSQGAGYFGDGTWTVVDDDGNANCDQVRVVNGFAGHYNTGLWINATCTATFFGPNGSESVANDLIDNGKNTTGILEDASGFWELYLGGSTSGHVQLTVPATVTSYTWKYPSADAAGLVKSDGSGNLGLVSGNCASSGGTCGSAAFGHVSIAAGATTVTVTTTAVTANSEIFIQEDSTVGSLLSVTCNTGITRDYAVTSRTAATSFIITASAAPVTNPACLTYWVIN